MIKDFKCESCNREFKDEDALTSNNLAKHSELSKPIKKILQRK